MTVCEGPQPGSPSPEPTAPPKDRAGTNATRFTIRTRPEDFVVVEEPLYPASGVGTHLFLEVEKRGRTTEQVARALAQGLGVAAGDVGYAGRKDRHAVTRQWFSVPVSDGRPGGEGDAPVRDGAVARALALELEGARVLTAVPHGHKLRTGHLRANHFDLAVHCDAPFDPASLEARRAELARRGVPNRFGEQRFGRAGDNAEQARRLFSGGASVRDRRAARFLLSSLQAEVFNAVLAERLDAYDGVALGDVARVEASGGLFWVDDLAREAPRAEAFEISATGPIFGPKMRAPRGEIARLEADVLARHGIPGDGRIALPRGLHAPGTRRPLRIRPDDLTLAPLADGFGFRARFSLPAGAYATVVLEALVGPVVDAGGERGAHDAALAPALSSLDAS